MTKVEITQELVKWYFNYINGILYWAFDGGGHIKKGKIAGGIGGAKNDRRHLVRVAGATYPRSRLVFLYHHGYLPEVVDHKNINPLDDRIENLRAASKSENNKNCKSRRNSTSKYLGVSIYGNYKNTWVAQIQINGKNKRIGYFKSEIEAAIAYNKEAGLHHKEFANLNIINDT